MSVFDIIIFVLLGISAVFGFRKGLVMQLFGLLAIFLGVYCAFKFSGLASSLVAKLADVDTVTLSAISFIITMLIVWISIIFLGRMVTQLFKIAALGMLNRLFGMIFAVVQTLFISSAIVYAFGYLKITDNTPISNDFEKSIMYKPMQRVAEVVFPYINFIKSTDIL